MTRSEPAAPEYRAIAYLRAPSADRPTNDDGVDAQRVQCQRLAEKLGAAIVDQFVEPARATTARSAP